MSYAHNISATCCCSGYKPPQQETEGRVKLPVGRWSFQAHRLRQLWSRCKPRSGCSLHFFSEKNKNTHQNELKGAKQAKKFDELWTLKSLVLIFLTNQDIRLEKVYLM